VRAQLTKFYDAHFHLLDVGVAFPLSADANCSLAAPSLLHRFATPDVIVRDTVTEEQRDRQPPDSQAQHDSIAASPGHTDEGAAQRMRRRDYVRRLSLNSWLGDGVQLAVVGEAGSGKSTLLRCIALDLFGEQTVFPPIGRRWGGFLPVHVSFS